MRFRIVYDKPGRLRLRAGAYAFEREYEARSDLHAPDFRYDLYDASDKEHRHEVCPEHRNVLLPERV